MPLLAASGLRFTHGQDVILDGATLSIEPGDRIGLVGRNGTGKTTLLRLLEGALKPDVGELSRQKGTRLGVLRQDPDVCPDRTLRAEAATAFDELRALHEELDRLFTTLETESDPDRIETLLKRQTVLQEAVDAAGGYAIDHRIDAVLHGLGFTDDQFDIRVDGLSGGQVGRLALAKLLLAAPDLLFLDEPTNHLDIAGREWLETFLLEEFNGAVLMVSHDRAMLDNVVTRIVEVEDGRLIDYPGNYTAFRRQRADRKMTQARAYEKQQAKFKREEAFIRKFKAGQRAKQARGRESRLEREREATAIERPLEMESFGLTLAAAPRTGDQVIIARGASAWYDNEDGSRATTLFDGLEVTISRGERWGIIGPNGAGKTTLVSCLLGDRPLETGNAKLGTNVRIGYFRQFDPTMNEEQTVYRYLQDVMKKESPDSLMSEQQARDLAGAFLFSGSDQERPLQEMSGGERARARLAGLLASAKNLLVLDEPTNHLDIPSAERLEDALRPDRNKGAYAGTLLLISHDRALIDATCDHLIVLDGEGGARVVHGTYSEWRAREAASAAQASADAEAASRRTAAASKKKQPDPPVGAGAEAAPGKSVSWMPTERLEKEIEQHEGRLREIDELLATEAVYADADRCRELLAERETVQESLGVFEEAWLGRLEG